MGTVGRLRYVGIMGGDRSETIARTSGSERYDRDTVEWLGCGGIRWRTEAICALNIMM